MTDGVPELRSTVGIRSTTTRGITRGRGLANRMARLSFGKLVRVRYIDRAPQAG